MHKAMSVFLLMIFFGLNGCIPAKRSAVHMMPSKLPATATPVASRVTYATLPPPETATATSTPIPTPILPALNNAVVKDADRSTCYRVPGCRQEFRAGRLHW